MLYAYTLTIPANTAESDPEELKAKLTHGVITYVEIEFPPGCAGLVYAYVNRALHQVWPTNPEGKLRTDGRAIVWNDYYELFDEPFDLELEGWNLDDSYSHDILFRFEITSKEVAERGKEAAGVIGKIRGMLGV